MADEKQNAVCNAMIDCHARTFNSTQSSQLFINCCFAIAFAGIFFVCTEAFRNNEWEGWHHRVAIALWIGLSLYVVFAVWRQYSNYLIPLQFYRNEPESDIEEGTTFFITFGLALFPLVFFVCPRLGLIPLFLIIFGNIRKIRQMNSAVCAALTHCTMDGDRKKEILQCLTVFHKRSNSQLYLVIGSILYVAIDYLFIQLDPKSLRFVLVGYAPAFIYFSYYYVWPKRRKRDAAITEAKKYMRFLSKLEWPKFDWEKK